MSILNLQTEEKKVGRQSTNLQLKKSRIRMKEKQSVMVKVHLMSDTHERVLQFTPRMILLAVRRVTMRLT